MSKSRTYTALDKKKHRSVIGSIGTLNIDEISVSVKVIGERFRFGRLDLQVRPLAGTGSRWVEFHNVTFGKK